VFWYEDRVNFEQYYARAGVVIYVTMSIYKDWCSIPRGAGCRRATVFAIKWNIFNMKDTFMLLVDNIVACRPVTMQRPRNKKQRPLTSSRFQRRTFPLLRVPELPPCFNYQLLTATAHNFRAPAVL
jgi:hypothetical protein